MRPPPAGGPPRAGPHGRMLGRVLGAEQPRLEGLQRTLAHALRHGPVRARERRQGECRGDRGRRGRHNHGACPHRAPGLLVTSRTIHVDLLRQARHPWSGHERVYTGSATRANLGVVARTPRSGEGAPRGAALASGGPSAGRPRTRSDRTVPTVQGLEFAYALYALPPGRLPFRRWRWELWHGATLVASGWRLARPDAGAALRHRAAEFGCRLFGLPAPTATRAGRARPAARGDGAGGASGRSPACSCRARWIARRLSPLTG